GELGPEAKAAVPALRKSMARNFHPAFTALWKVDPALITSILKDRSDPNFLNVLAGVGSETRELEPIVLALAKDRNNPHRDVALSRLVEIGADPKRVVPVLLEGMDEDDQLVRLMSILALTLMGSDAKAALPRLHQALSDPLPSVRVEASNAVWVIEKEAKDVV